MNTLLNVTAVWNVFSYQVLPGAPVECDNEIAHEHLASRVWFRASFGHRVKLAGETFARMYCCCQYCSNWFTKIQIQTNVYITPASQQNLLAHRLSSTE